MPKKIKTMSHSKILKCLVRCLENEMFTHVLNWSNRDEKKFSILFVHKSSPAWHVSYLDLFKELDGLSKKKLEVYLTKPNYELDCKVRCKSNLKKLCAEGALSECWKKSSNKSEYTICYKINDSSGIYLPLLEHTQQKHKSKMTMSHRGVTFLKTIQDMNIELLNSSDYPCLSNQTMSNKDEAVQEDIRDVDNGELSFLPSVYPYFTNETMSNKNEAVQEDIRDVDNDELSFLPSVYPYFTNEDLTSLEPFCRSLNGLIYKKDLENGIYIENNAFNEDLSSRTCSEVICGSPKDFKNDKNLKSGIYLENDDSVSKKYAVDFIGSNNILINQNNVENWFLLENTSFDKVLRSDKTVKEVVSGNYEHADCSFYQNMQGPFDDSTSTKVVEEGSFNINAVMSHILGNTENSFDLNNVMQVGVGFDEYNSTLEEKFCVDAEVIKVNFFILKLVAKQAKIK